MSKDQPKPGPAPDRLKIKGDWIGAVKKALGKKRPPEGWPEREPKKKEPGNESSGS